MAFSLGRWLAGDNVNHRVVMTSFLVANLSDLILTGLAMSLPGFREMGLGASWWFSVGQQTAVYATKMGVAAVFLGAYAMAIPRGGLWRSVAVPVLRMGCWVVWAAVVWNAVNIVATLATLGPA